jgi:hypothetical protein
MELANPRVSPMNYTFERTRIGFRALTHSPKLLLLERERSRMMACARRGLTAGVRRKGNQPR